MGFKEIVEQLKSAGTDYAILEHLKVRTMQDVVEDLNLPQNRVLKTMVFIKDAERWIVAVTMGNDRVDYRKLSHACMINRKSIRRASVQQIESDLGMEIGGLSPLCIGIQDIITVFDQKLSGLGLVYCGVGRRDKTLQINIDDLIVHASGSFADIAK